VEVHGVAGGDRQTAVATSRYRGELTLWRRANGGGRRHLGLLIAGNAQVRWAQANKAAVNGACVPRHSRRNIRASKATKTH